MNKYLKRIFMVLSLSSILCFCLSMNAFAVSKSNTDTIVPTSVRTTQENISGKGNIIIETTRVAIKTNVAFSNTSGAPINFTVATNPRFVNSNLSVTVKSGRNASVTVPFTTKTRAARPHKLYISLYNPNGGKITGIITYNDYA